MLNKYIVPTGVVACVVVFIFAVQAGREQMKTSSLPLNVVSQTYKEVVTIAKADSQSVSQIAPTPSEPEGGPCTKADYQRADGRYDPIDAYNFGLKIQSAVSAEDITSLFSLVEDESSNIPQKSFALGSEFSALFLPNTKKRVLESTPGCSHFNSEGFLIGDGGFWYRADNQGVFHIFSMPAARKTTILDFPSVGWAFKGGLLPLECFSTEWISSDNYQEYAEQFEIADYDDFSTNMGEYFGREVTNLKPIVAWGEDLSLVRSISTCSSGKPSPEIRDGYAWASDNGSSLRLIGQIDIGTCNALAPSLNNTCSRSFVVEHRSFYGTMGADWQYYAYGLFDLPELGPSIVPLKNLGSLNRSLNFVDEQRQVIACDNVANIKKEVTLISSESSQSKFQKVDIYCDESWAAGSSLRRQYLQRLDENGNPTGPVIGGDEHSEEMAYSALRLPNQIDVLNTPAGFPLLAVGLFDYSASNIFMQVLLLDPESNFDVVKTIDNPLNKYQSSKYEEAGSGPENELEGIYEDQGEYYINTLDLINYDDRKYAVTKNLIRRSPPYLSRVSTALFSDP